MTDIVERLRHGHTRYAAETHQEATIRRIKAMDEAADEIERLREEIKWCADANAKLITSLQQMHDSHAQMSDDKGQR